MKKSEADSKIQIADIDSPWFKELDKGRILQIEYIENKRVVVEYK